jgi:hypothetical protein
MMRPRVPSGTRIDRNASVPSASFRCSRRLAR